MKNITQKDIEKFKKYLQNEERAAATIEKYIRDISAFSVWLDGKGIDNRSPAECNKASRRREGNL